MIWPTPPKPKWNAASKGARISIMFYWAIVHHDAGSAYGVTFPDLDGCFAAADDESDVMAAAIEALDLYFEDVDEAPRPRGLSEVHSTYREDLAQGAYLIQVPLIKRTTRSVRVNLSFDQGLLEAIDAAAKRAGLNRSAYLAMAAQESIKGGPETQAA